MKSSDCLCLTFMFPYSFNYNHSRIYCCLYPLYLFDLPSFDPLQSFSHTQLLTSLKISLSPFLSFYTEQCFGFMHSYTYLINWKRSSVLQRHVCRRSIWDFTLFSMFAFSEIRSNIKCSKYTKIVDCKISRWNSLLHKHIIFTLWLTKVSLQSQFNYSFIILAL